MPFVSIRRLLDRKVIDGTPKRGWKSRQIANKSWHVFAQFGMVSPSTKRVRWSL
jgi:hypothetical protein